jgi:adenylyltransferase/sulfurtransferase
VAELAALLDARGSAPVLLDVREPFEWQIVRLPEARHVPLGQLPSRLHELEPGREIIAYCHSGVRSLQAVSLLRGAGFSARSLAGGIDAWARERDPAMARY